jgi:hypothetical protein
MEHLERHGLARCCVIGGTDEGKLANATGRV